MKKLLLILGVLALGASTSFSQVIVCKNGNISFFQETSVENIDGRSTRLVSVIDTKTNIIAYKVEMTSFQFEKSLMQDHFNENYVESGKYPYTVFKGQINETIDWTKDGTYPITATGMMTMHGVTKTITEKGTLTIRNGEVTISNNFNIKFTDYGVEIPSLLIKQLSDTVEVTINCTYVPLKK
jgi:polyisoprenoid-binding protein YceI